MWVYEQTNATPVTQDRTQNMWVYEQTNATPVTQDRTQNMWVYEQTNATPVTQDNTKNAGVAMCGYKDSRFDSSLSPRHGLVQLQIQRFLLGNGVSSILLNLF